MLIRLPLVVVLGLVFVSSDTLAADDWKTHTDSEASFEASFPTRPTVSTGEITIGETPVTLHRVSSVQADGAIAFSITHHELPADTRSLKPDVLFERAETAASKRIGESKPLSRTDFKLGSHPGREFVLSGKIGSRPILLRTRLVITEQRLFQISAVRVGNASLDPTAVDQFLGSFRLTD